MVETWNTQYHRGWSGARWADQGGVQAPPNLGTRGGPSGAHPQRALRLGFRDFFEAGFFLVLFCKQVPQQLDFLRPPLGKKKTRGEEGRIRGYLPGPESAILAGFQRFGMLFKTLGHGRTQASREVGCRPHSLGSWGPERGGGGPRPTGGGGPPRLGPEPCRTPVNLESDKLPPPPRQFPLFLPEQAWPPSSGWTMWWKSAPP